jgi:ACS family tartrate transporter-like MFS transporter
MTEQQIFATCARLILFLGLLFAVSGLDRVNVGFAALTMNRDLGFPPEIYGFAHRVSDDQALDAG